MTARAPSGVVTFLFTDVEGSTRRWEARDEAEHINARIELIDGSRLAELLVQYGIGVQPEQSVTLYRLDEDFFDSI